MRPSIITDTPVPRLPGEGNRFSSQFFSILEVYMNVHTYFLDLKA